MRDDQAGRISMRSDADLLAAARTEPSAFRELYERHAASIHAFHLSRCGDRDAAYDLTAETFAQAWLSRIRFRDRAGGSAKPWLFTIARNVLVSSVRRKTLEVSACERLGLAEWLGRAPEPSEPDESWLDGLDEAFASLPANQRDAIQLRVVDELPYREVAVLLGTSTQAARVRVHRGLADLRSRFGNRSEEGR